MTLKEYNAKIDSCNSIIRETKAEKERIREEILKKLNKVMKNFDFSDFCLNVIIGSLTLLILSGVIRLVMAMFFGK